MPRPVCRAKRAAYDSSLQNARNLRADIDAAEAQARLADRELRDSAIRAPFDAFIQKRLVSPGSTVKVQTPVMSLVKIDPLKLTGEIPERMAPWVQRRPDGDASRSTPSRTARSTGRSRASAPAVNPQTRAFPLEAPRAQRRRPSQAGHVRARSYRLGLDRRRADGAGVVAAVPLRRQPCLRGQGRRAASRARSRSAIVSANASK